MTTLPGARRRLAVVASAAMVAALIGACGGGAARAASSSTSTSSVPASTTTSTAATTTTTPACPTDSEALTAGESTVRSGGVTRHFLVALPPSFDRSRPTPLIVNFHGSGSDMGEAAAYSRLPTLATARGWVVVTPDGTGTPRGWDLGGDTDVTFVGDLLAAVGRGMCVDTARVDAIGISNGSAFSEIAGCHAPFPFAAVAMIAATLPSTCPPEVRIPAIAFHGTKDPVVPYGGGKVSAEVRNTRRLAAPGAEGAIAALAQHNGCGATPRDTAVGRDVTRRTWSGCADGADVVFYRIAGGGHTWPGPIDLSKLGITALGATSSTVDATQLALDFFEAHPRAVARGAR